MVGSKKSTICVLLFRWWIPRQIYLCLQSRQAADPEDLAVARDVVFGWKGRQFLCRLLSFLEIYHFVHVLRRLLLLTFEARQSFRNDWWGHGRHDLNGRREEEDQPWHQGAKSEEVRKTGALDANFIITLFVITKSLQDFLVKRS